jgi:hypothetical protein
MKLKDLKPGMVVAVGSIRSVNASWGMGWKECRRAVVVGIGYYHKRNYGYPKISIERNPKILGVKKSVLIARGSGNPDMSAIPDAVPANKILCTWEECLHNQEKEQRERQEQKEREASERDARHARLARLGDWLEKLGVRRTAVWAGRGTNVILTLDTLESILQMVENKGKE